MTRTSGLLADILTLPNPCLWRRALLQMEAVAFRGPADVVPLCVAFRVPVDRSGPSNSSTAACVQLLAEAHRVVPGPVLT